VIRLGHIEAAAWRFLVRYAGGFYECGALAIIVHDFGLDMAWRRILVREWRIPRG
jgi:hypothetical protein